MGSRYVIMCDIDAASLQRIDASLEEVANSTRTTIDVQPCPDSLEERRLCISGRLPDVYSAHLKIMWELNESSDTVQRMEDQIAQIRDQLEALKREQRRR